jgi:hypothetical protein
VILSPPQAALRARTVALAANCTHVDTSGSSNKVVLEWQGINPAKPFHAPHIPAPDRAGLTHVCSSACSWKSRAAEGSVC